jgi:hypothetical protein
LRTFATITTDANRQLSATQDRMPVIIELANWSLWPGEVEGDPATPLRAAAEDLLRVWPIDKKVGDVRNGGPQLLEPRAPTEAPLNGQGRGRAAQAPDAEPDTLAMETELVAGTQEL